MTILEQWQRLIFPPDTNDLRGGERLADERKTIGSSDETP